MFSRKFSGILQNDHFVEHFQVAALLIRKASWLDHSYLFLFLLTSVRVTLELLAINV